MHKNRDIIKYKKYIKLHSRTISDIFPASETYLIKSKPSIIEHNLQNGKTNKDSNCNNDSNECRVNEVNIQMVSENFYKQLFKKPRGIVDPKIVKICQENLLKHGINFRECGRLPEVELKLPTFDGNDIIEHMHNIGEKQSAPYRELLQELAFAHLPELPKTWSKTAGWCRYQNGRPPEPVPCPSDDALILDVEVLMSAGQRPTLACAVSSKAWYGWVSAPLANNDAHQSFDSVNYEDLIPLETDGFKECGDLNRPRIIVGHNVSYDRSKIKEQYWLKKTGVRFMDTMSMHTCVSGVTSYQRAILKSKAKESDSIDDDWMQISSLNSLGEVHKLYCGKAINKDDREIFVKGNLDDVHKNFQKLMAYCASDVIATSNVLNRLFPMFLERFPHPATMAGMLHLGTAYLPVNSNWLQYLDSSQTIYDDFKLEIRQLLSLKADDACRMMENDAYKEDLWMWDEDWSTQELKLKKPPKPKKKTVEEEFVTNIDSNNIKTSVPEEDINVKREFKLLNDDFIKSATTKFESSAPNKNIESLNKKFEYLNQMGKLLPVKRPFLAGYPAWYRKLCEKPSSDIDWSPGANNITTTMRITPKLLRLSWEGYPLYYKSGDGWGFLVPASHRQECNDEEAKLPLRKLLEACPMKFFENDENFEGNVFGISKSVEADMGKRSHYARKKLDETAAANQYHGLGVWSGIRIQGCCNFLRLPHKNGPKYKVGNPLSRDFLEMFSQNVLKSQGDETAEKVLSFGRKMSYWRNNRERIISQQVVWLPKELTPAMDRSNGMLYGAIIPRVVVCGTLTRRASEPTWMTASNAHPERIGSELRAMVQAPPNYHFVGADVDSQELWIAALLGDSTVSLCGGTPFGWAVLAGSKQNDTDLHSLTAKAANISRDHAKVINYARIYGAGQNFAARLLKQYNPTMTVSEANSKAKIMFATTKGKKFYTLKKEYATGFIDDEEVVMPEYQAYRTAKMSGKRIEEMFERARWVGGTESDMFNKLEEIAESEAPTTAFLGGRLSRSLEDSSGRWAGTRLNWCVQSAAADFLHLMLVLMEEMAPNARFCLSFHDEVRYLAPDEHKYKTALALQLTNLMTRAFCSERVGIHDLPLSIAFFTSVEVDRVLRKESNISCETPSNPHGLEKGYRIPNGESLNISDILKKCDL